jgi:hypothetical protein
MFLSYRFAMNPSPDDQADPSGGEVIVWMRLGVASRTAKPNSDRGFFNRKSQIGNRKCRTCHTPKSATFCDIRDIWGTAFSPEARLVSPSRSLAHGSSSEPKKRRQTAPNRAICHIVAL